MRYTDLVFDLYGTLVDIHTEEDDAAWEKTALYMGYHGCRFSGNSLREAFGTEMKKREAKAGQGYEMYPEIPFDSVLADLFRTNGITEHADALGLNAAQVFRVTSTEYIRLYDGVLTALDVFRKQGFRLWLLSNAQRAFTAYELRQLGLCPQFDGIYLSSDYQCRKPDIRFFRILLDERQLTPSSCLMIGNDRETDIAGAQSAGMATLYMHTNLTPAHQAKADLRLTPSKEQNGNHYEYEGTDWYALQKKILQL